VGAVLAYDICNMESYKHIPVWLMEAKRHIEPHQATFLLVGCKRDLATTDREVSKETAQALADYHGIPFLETSSKSGENVEEAFSLISQTIYDKVQRGEYKVEEGWDGIKPGFLQRAGAGQGGLVEAQPTSGGCC